MSRLVVDALHDDQLLEHGGLSGLRDENALESALARPRQKWHYSDRGDLAAIAAAYGFGLVQDHPYRDGNERVGFLAIVTFLGVNGFDFEAGEAGIVTVILQLAPGSVSEQVLADWIRPRISRQR